MKLYAICPNSGEKIFVTINKRSLLCLVF